VDALSEITELMTRLRDTPPDTLLGAPCTVEDLRPQTDAVRWRAGGARVVIRPSGTEPKLKAYLEVVEAGGSAERAAERLAALRAEVDAALGR
jgi:phosphomannomutase